MIEKLSCSLAGTTQPVHILSGTLAHRIYGVEETVEAFRCSYGLNPGYREQLERSGVRVSGTGSGGEVRIVELPDHPFFVATLFLPQLSSQPGKPHPLLVAFLRAAREARHKTMDGTT